MEPDMIIGNADISEELGFEYGKEIAHRVVSVQGLCGCWYGSVDTRVVHVPVPLGL